MARQSVIMLLTLISLVMLEVGAGAGDDKSEVVNNNNNKNNNNKVVGVSALLGATVKLPCDTTPPRPENPLLLTVWFKDLLQDPIYRYKLL